MAIGRPRKDIVAGTRFGNLKILSEAPSKGYVRLFLCKCDCGITKEIRRCNLISGATTSCGCLSKKQRLKAITKHGMSKHPIYKVYRHIKDRCYNKANKSYKDYGGRGITVCEKWLGKDGFINFLNWNSSLPKNKRWRRGLEIDRKNNNGSYQPNNCRWVSRKKNLNNKRNTVFVEHKGVVYPFTEFHAKFKSNRVTYACAITRYKRGWDALEACTLKSGRYKSQYY